MPKGRARSRVLLAAAALLAPAAAMAAPAAASNTAAPAWEDFYAITSAAYTFADALDHRDWPTMRTVFADVVDVDTTGAGNATGRANISAENFIWRVRIQETGFEGTELLLGNPRVTVKGDRASLVMAFYGEHVAAVASGDNFYTIGGYQDFELTRIGGRWLISGFRLSPTWTKGNRDVMSVGLRRGVERLKQEGVTPPAEIAAEMKW